MPTQITAHTVTKSYGGRIVLDAVTCSLAAGERTGIVGENGSGKSTLLRLLAGRERPDQGEIVVQAEGGVGYLSQEDDLPAGLTAGEVIDRALSELRALERRLRALEALLAAGDESPLAAYGELQTVFELRGGYEADARVARALHGLGLRGLPRERPVDALSGGERVRLRLAALLAAAPEVLLLDEPTNHLDDAATAWLEEHLRARRGTTVAVSHDRVFLDRVATGLLEVDGDRRTAARYGGGYAGYLAAKAAERRRWAERYDGWRAELARQREAAATTARRVAPGRGPRDGNKMAYDRAGGRVQQSLAGRVRNAEERVRRLLAAPVPPPPEPLRFALPAHAGPPAGTVLEAAGIGLAGRLAPVDVKLAAGERLLVTGPNGAGKSTLLRVLAGQLAADTGRLDRRGPAGHLAQEPAPARPGETVLDAFARGRAGTPQEQAERLLALGLFAEDRLETPVAGLSTGQRRRLELARLLSAPAHTLLLDEPTNHLSPALAEQLEEAMRHFPGALVVVSHDRRLRRGWRGPVLALRPVADAAPGPVAFR
ncbi:ribosomal protection-like ABC-F family protein [Streptomyces hoynatensis]|uniref:ABC transporter ATP-binding protein n=1 Tax=Streptomyces hoynatensis TaxID=1141874 RepID=A0A3A9Z4L1_9ACTN|nr:ABC-F family ATP-binding cassette domain-containing protein [Streptomyces hoynatensis]RKN43205.1 ABC transporter ATP-binding protein [Streptomyces hoynatensis]